MTLDELVRSLESRLEVIERSGDQRVVITGVTDDSRDVSPGTLFVAVKGERADPGPRMLPKARRTGSRTIHGGVTRAIQPCRNLTRRAERSAKVAAA